MTTSTENFGSFRPEYEVWRRQTQTLPFRSEQNTSTSAFELELQHLIDHLQLVFADAAGGATKFDYPTLVGPNLHDLDKANALLENEAQNIADRRGYLQYLAQTRRLLTLLGSLPVQADGHLGFRRSALDAFLFLTEEYEFCVSETSPIRVLYVSNALFAEVCHAPEYPMLSIQIGRRTGDGKSTSSFSLDDFAYALGMGIVFEYDAYDLLDSFGVEKFLQTAANIVRRGGDLLLGGDAEALRVFEAKTADRERYFIAMMERLHPAESS